MARGVQFYGRAALLWGLFFVICLSLGYPTLNRYDPAKSNLADAGYYKRLVVRGPEAVPDYYWRYRVLVPYVAKPFYRLARGRVGTWDPAYFGLLVSNAIFVASTALVLVLIALNLGGSMRLGLFASFLFLLQFNVSNLYLAGLVDSAEVFFMTVLAWTLINGKWRLLPVLGIAGALAKETFIPLSALFAGGWHIAERWPIRLRAGPLLAIIGMVVLGLATFSLLRFVLGSGVLWPWQVAASEKGTGEGFLRRLVDIFLNRHFYYTFLWLIPLGALGLRHTPRAWIGASALAFAGAAFLSAWADAGANVGRPLFAAAGPMLIFASAAFLWDLLGVAPRGGLTKAGGLGQGSDRRPPGLGPGRHR